MRRGTRLESEPLRGLTDQPYRDRQGAARFEPSHRGHSLTVVVRLLGQFFFSKLDQNSAEFQKAMHSREPELPVPS